MVTLDLSYPPTLKGDGKDDLKQLRSYLKQTADQLMWAFNQLEQHEPINVATEITNDAETVEAVAKHVRRIMAKSEPQVKVFESGLGNLFYRLHNDGSFDFWGELSVTPTGEGTASDSNAAYYTSQFQFNLPFNAENCSFSVNAANSYAWATNCANTNEGSGKLSFRLYKFKKFSTTTVIYVNIVGHGTKI